MSASVTNPISAAVEGARARLFRPFVFDKWVHLGFIAFLANLGEGGTNSGAQFPFSNWGKGTGPSGKGVFETIGPQIDEAIRWTGEHVSVIVVLAVFALVLGTAFGALIMWLSSRGKFMFVEAVIHDRWEVKEPWERLRTPAWSLFKFRFLLSAIASVAFLGAVGLAAVFALPDLRSGTFGQGAWIGAGILGSMFLVVGLPMFVLLAIVDDFVVPAMYLRGELVGGGFRQVREHVLQGQVGTVFAFYLVKALVGVGVGLIAVVAVCATCCVAAIPYVGTVILLPIHVFWRLYSLYFLEELGWQVFPSPAPAPWANATAGLFLLRP